MKKDIFLPSGGRSRKKAGPVCCLVLLFLLCTLAVPAAAASSGNAIGQWLDSTLGETDLKILLFIASLHSKALTVAMNLVTHLGDVEFAVPMGLLGLILCFFPKTRRVGLAMLTCALLEGLFINLLLKNLCFRARPYVTLRENAAYFSAYTETGSNLESDNSFPSGHTAVAFALGTVWFLLLWNSLQKAGRKALSLLRGVLLCLCPLYAVTIAFSRLYLMMHYPSDVLAGMVVGIFTGILANTISGKLMHRTFKNKPKGAS